MRIPNTQTRTWAIPAIGRNIISFLFLFLLFTTGNAQSVWTWMSGDNTANQAGVYGTKGTAAAANKPCNRDSYSAWKDASGNFWVFGGWDISSNRYNDLWKYNPGTGQWTWISGDNTTNVTGVHGTKGTPAATNKPGSRYGTIEWTDASGNFWIHGGYGIDGAGNVGYLDDLWKYNPTTNEWTWMSGDNTRNITGVYGTKGTAAAANKPGGRYYGANGIDASGNLWLLGGYGYDGAGAVGLLNDLWKFNPTTSQWTWVSGDNTRNNLGVYGTKGTAAATNKPGGRNVHSSWVDAAGNFWTFGGRGIDGAGTTAYMNDLWKYNPGTGQWTWVSGDNTGNGSGVYGTKGTGATTNKPGARGGQGVVVDAMGNFWFFGGYGYDAAGAAGALNDLWVYTPASGKWRWESGDNARNIAGVYGTKGTGAAANKPGARALGTIWLDGAGNLWTFGGYDVGSNDFNDLWRFNNLVVLPLQQITLRGTHHNSDNLLNWETTGEENTNQFIVERSTNGADYTAFGRVAAVGAGNNRYSFTDYGAANTTWYYRLQVTDKNGQVYYSSFIILSAASDARISVYPNPTSKGITLALSDNSLLNTPAKLYNAIRRRSNDQEPETIHRPATLSQRNDDTEA
jgi:N-acetylneuraminic acid mutarotase